MIYGGRKRKKAGTLHNMNARGAKQVRDSFGYLLERELPALVEVIDSLPPNSVCVNIGAGSGTSGLTFMESKKVGRLYTVDLFRETRPEGALGNELVAFKDAGFLNDPRYSQIHGDSAAVGKNWTGEQLDMVFIDGGHSYEQCHADIENWLPHIKQGGVMALHDYLANVWPGVEQSVAELLLPKYRIISYVDTFVAFRVINK